MQIDFDARLDPPGEPGRRYTVDEFETLSDTKGFELVDGFAVEKPGDNYSGQVTANLVVALGLFVRRHRLGFVGTQGAGFALGDPANLRTPDVSFVARGRYPGDRPPKGFARIAPDFAFESVGWHDLADDMQARIEEYLRAGVRLVWVAYPEAQVVLAYRPDGTVRRHVGTDPLTTDDLFPGFACTPADLFAVG